jgi:hypothetical protein
LLSGIRLDYDALFRNWQYLDVHTLRYNLLNGIWYDHTQPPVFNLLLGLILKLAGSYARLVFVLLLKGISLINALLLLSILKRTVRYAILPLIIALLYLLSPASIIFENELFYTTFISLLLLISCFFLTNLKETINWRNAAGFFLPLVVICMTRSLYHLVWLIGVAGMLLFYYRKKGGGWILLTCSLASVLLVGSWYVKNYFVFNSFSASTWMGMNLARNVFHDAEIPDSSNIASIEPFSKISTYKNFLSGFDETKYAGLNDLDLLQEMKNDSFINEKNVGYMVVSKKYMEASKLQIRTHPLAYLKNILQSAIIFFAPATRYSVIESEARKIKYYDLVYSFNLSHFARGKQQRRIAMTLSAIPKMIIYLLVFSLAVRQAIHSGKIGFLQLFIATIIGYIFCVSSLFEHYENMRFRYEAEPLFLILVGQTIADYLQGKHKKKALPGEVD